MFAKPESKGTDVQEVQTLIEPRPVASLIVPSPWYVMLAAPQQEISTVWRLHELGLEMFVPVIRRRVKTGRIGKNGHKVTRVIAKPMFPGYGFLRVASTEDPDRLIWRERQATGVRGVREVMRDCNGDAVMLPHAAVAAVFARQLDEQQHWIEENGGRKKSAWKTGDSVKIDDDGGVYAGLLARIEKVESKERIHLLLGAAKIRHIIAGDKIVAV